MGGVASGSLLAGYRIDSLLGEGGMGAVYRAWQAELERFVALKVISERFAREPAFHARFQREAVAAAAIDHPNVVPIYEAGVADDRLFLAMRLIDGSDLATLIEREAPLDPRHAIAVAAQIASALDAAHARGLLHRDVKPANVLIAGNTPTGHVYLTDFGVARRLGADTPLTSPGQLVGTVAYLAPEVVRGDAVGPSADVYSLGCVLFHALTGKVPFERENELAVLLAHRDEPPPILTDLIRAPSELGRVMQRALAKLPEQRYASATALTDAARAAIQSAAERRRSPTSSAATAVDARPELPEPPGWAPIEPRLVGRERELRRIVDALDALGAGGRPLIAIGGEPGIGKTRLAQELCDRATARGALVAWGRCFEAEATSPYRPIVSMLRTVIESLPDGWIDGALGAREADLAILLPELAGVAQFEDAERPSGDERLRMFDGVVAFLSKVSGLAPVMLVFDDLHAADRSSAALLEHLIRHIETHPILLVATFRSTHADDDQLGQWLEQAQHERELVRVDLQGLRADEVGELLAVLCGPDAAGADRAAIAVQTGGNPFFVRELAARYGEGDSAAALPDGQLPESVLSAMDQRFARLDRPCRELLQRLAVAPAGAATTVLMALDMGGSDIVIDAVERGIRAGILRERVELGTAIVDFAHPLYRQAILDRMSAARRADFHRRMAGAITRVAGRADERWLGELAYHTFAAGNVGDPTEVVAICRRAGDAAKSRTGFDDAVINYQHALEALSWGDAPPASLRADIALACARAYRGAGDGEPARRMAHAAFSDAASVGDADLMAQAALVHAGARSTYGVMDQRTKSLLEQALDALRRSGDDRLSPHVLSRLTQEHYIGGHYDIARALSAEAIGIASSGGDDLALVVALEGRVWPLHAPDLLDERSAVVEKLVRCAERAGEREWLMLGLIWRACTRLERGEIEGVDADLARLDDMAEVVRAPSHVFRVATLRATRAMMIGDYERGLALAQAAYGIGQPIESDNADQTLRAQLLGMMREQNLLAGVAPLVEQMAESHADAPGWGCALAFVYAEADLQDKARRQLEFLAASGFDRIPRDLAWLLGFCYLAEVIAALDDDGRARDLYPLLVPFADRNASVFEIQSAGSVAHFLGLLARTAGEAEQAGAHFRDAIDFNDRTGQRPAAARSRYEYARLLIASGGQEPAAREVVSAALATANELGLTRLNAQAGAVQQRLAAGSA